MQPSPKISFFAANPRGRDYVVGDIHGCFKDLGAKLRAACFDTKTDRLFAVGDLIDRGPSSADALEWLSRPWFIPVRGNHEQMFLELYAEGEPDDDALEAICRRNGMNWWIHLEDSTRQSFLRAFARLPLAIQIETPRGTVGLVHADVPIGMNWGQFLRLLGSGDERTIQTALWSRKRLERSYTGGVPGVGRLFTGHTIVKSVERLGNVYFVDSGAFLAPLHGEDAGLTVSLLVAKTSDLSGARFNDPAPLHSGSAEPFGNYVDSTHS